MGDTMELDELVCLVSENKASTEQEESFTEQTRKIINSFMFTHSVDSEAYEDVVSSILLYVLENMYKYEKDRNKFSTWVYWMSLHAWFIHNDNLKKYKKLYDKDFVKDNPSLELFYRRIISESNFILDIDFKHDMKLAVQALFKRYKKKSDILFLLFGGNPFDVDYSFSFSYKLSEISKVSNINVVDVRRFIHTRVYPFLKFFLKEYNA